jgi:hypothetical protein
VNPPSATAAGPARTRDDAIDSRLLTSTNIRAARSVRLQIIALVAVTSPPCTPLGIAGASLSASTRDITAGAQARVRKVRRFIGLVGSVGLVGLVRLIGLVGLITLTGSDRTIRSNGSVESIWSKQLRHHRLRRCAMACQ